MLTSRPIGCIIEPRFLKGELPWRSFILSTIDFMASLPLTFILCLRLFSVVLKKNVSVSRLDESPPEFGNLINDMDCAS